MEQTLQRINADILLAAEDSCEPVAKFVRPTQDSQALEAAASRFAKLDKLSANLKMGSIQQLVTVSDDAAELSVHDFESKVICVASAPTLDRSYLAQDCVREVLKH